MPTSSQALILTGQPTGPTESLFKTQSMQVKEPAPYAIASLIDLSETAPSSTKSIDDSSIVKILGKESAQLFKYHNLPAGYTNILAYDTTRDCFKWQILRCYDKINNRNMAIAVNRDRELIHDGSIPRTAWAKRPSPSSSSLCESRANDSGPIRVESRSMYEHLIELGFRQSDLVFKEDENKTRKEVTFIDEDGHVHKSETRKGRMRRRFEPEVKGNVVEIPEVGRKKGGKTSEADGKVVKTPELWAERYEMPLPSPASSRTDCSGRKSAKQRCYSAKKVVINDTDSFSDVISDEVADHEDADGFYRIKPSFFMVKNTPKSRPTTAVLSLRENECSFHAEVKFFIETQTGACVKSIQYDPLHIRSGKPDVRSRWIVDFNNISDLEKVVKQGLIVGKDKIVIYKYDDIMRREFSAYKYFRAVNEAKKRLKAAKSTPDSLKAAACSTGKSKKKSLRNTKSAH